MPNITSVRSVRVFSDAVINEQESKSILRILREQKGLSQREFAAKLGISRTQLQRMEAKQAQDLSINEIRFIARGLGLGVDGLINQIFDHAEEDGCIQRCSFDQPLSLISFGEGVRFASFSRNTEACFIGSMTLEPKKTLSREQLPKGDFLFWLVLQGQMLLNFALKEHLFKERDCFSIRGRGSYEVYNPHQCRPLMAVAFSLPASARAVMLERSI